MASQLKFDWNEVEGTDKDERQFLNFPKEGGSLVMKFEDNDPFWTGIPTGDKFQRTKYMFKVTAGEDYDKMVFSVSSKVLMQQLSKLRPLEGKTVQINRAGTGFDTQYTAELL